jgi:predicted CXXCH cytochrome family protein
MTRKYAVLFAVVIGLLMTSSAFGQYSKIIHIVGSMHDFSSTSATHGPKAATFTQICYFCHAPHQNGLGGAQAPLWNHTLSSVGTYGVYSSPSFDALGTGITDLGGAAAGSAAVSNLCLSCHDGTVGINNLYNNVYDPVAKSVHPIAMNNCGDTGSTYSDSTGACAGPSFIAVGSTSSSNGLRDDHPINFVYDTTLAGKSASLVVPGSAPSNLGGAARHGVTYQGAFLPLFNDTMQCATCHDVHDNTTHSTFLRIGEDGSAICLACHGKS